jgi:hypothetical protein
MSEATVAERRPPAADFPIGAAVFLTVAIFTCSIYANLSFAVRDRADLRFFPPFQPYVDANTSDHLGGEALNIARSLHSGNGFADPFTRHTGPTAWMPPVLPGILAGLLWLTGGSRDAVMGIVVFLQVFVLIGTGVLVLALARRTSHIPAAVVALIYFGALLCNFRFWFQTTRDCWLVLLALDLVVAGLCWMKPLGSWGRALAWGLLGGAVAQVNPIVGFTWAVMTLLTAMAQHQWSRLGIAALAAVLAITPWMVRNYIVFSRWIPIKSNLAYELYQAQVLEPDGLMQSATIALHPHSHNSLEAEVYDELSETRYLDLKRHQFLQAVRDNPGEFLARLGQRFRGATLWYVPFDRVNEPHQQGWTIWISRAVHPLAFVALVILVMSSSGKPLLGVQWSVIGVYVFFLLPYVGVSYMERYAVPLVGVKVLLVVWAADRLAAALRQPGFMSPCHGTPQK